ncbi:MAG: hypothetical protein HKN77_07805 [Woeseiaceae bacterium]|nr:hypothetical protein [Woeseiaceae bacterium]
MNRAFEIGPTLLATVLLILAVPAQGSVNKDIEIAAGSASDGASSVNGRVRVGESATVSGKLSTVNGSIDIGRDASIQAAGTVNGGIRVSTNARTTDLKTVNGSIEISDQAQVGGEVTAVNGRISMASNSLVAHGLSNVNGEIALAGGRVEGDVSTVNGNVELSNGASIGGDLVIKEPKGISWGRDMRKPQIVIGPGSQVEGLIRAEREIELYISDRARVGGVEGKATMADAVRFSGDRP